MADSITGEGRENGGEREYREESGSYRELEEQYDRIRKFVNDATAIFGKAKLAEGEESRRDAVRYRQMLDSFYGFDMKFIKGKPDDIFAKEVVLEYEGDTVLHLEYGGRDKNPEVKESENGEWTREFLELMEKKEEKFEQYREEQVENEEAEEKTVRT